LVAELQKEHFSITETNDPATQYHYSAQYEVSGFMCKYVSTIVWSTEAGKITKIEGSTIDLCP